MPSISAARCGEAGVFSLSLWTTRRPSRPCQNHNFKPTHSSTRGHAKSFGHQFVPDHKRLLRADIVDLVAALFRTPPFSGLWSIFPVQFVKSIDFFDGEIMGYGDWRKIRATDLHVVDQTDEFVVGIGACVLQR